MSLVMPVLLLAASFAYLAFSNGLFPGLTSAPVGGLGCDEEPEKKIKKKNDNKNMRKVFHD